jgi:hypothetical protein
MIAGRTGAFAVVVGLACFVSAAGAVDYGVGPLVQVSGLSPYRDGCNGSGSHATSAAAEPTLAVNPQDPRDLVAAWMQDIDTNGATADAVAVSTDGGRSWTRQQLPRSGACNGGETQFAHVADPWAAFGPGGVVWVATLPYTNANPGAVAVHRSINGGSAFGDPQYVDRDQSPSEFDDKESIAADPRDSAGAYVTWVKQQVPPAPLPGVPLASTIYFARTLDGGSSWSRPQAIAVSPTGTAFAGGIIAVLPSGQLLLTYPQITPDDPTACVSDQECRGEVTVYALHSGDAGRTWSAPAVAARYVRAPVYDPEGTEVKASAEQYSLTIGPDGSAYLAAHDERDSPRSRIIVMRSTDVGASWQHMTDASSASPAQGPKLQPIIAAGPDALGILYYDFRDDTQPGDGRAEFSWWFDHSQDGGRSWHEQRVTGPSDLNNALGTPLQFGHFLGDYFALQPVGRDFIAALTVARPLAQQTPTSIFAVRLMAPGPISGLRISPTSVSIAGREIGGQCVKQTKANQNHKSCRRPIKLRVSYMLSAPTMVKFTLEQLRVGRNVRGHCVKRTKHDRNKPRCTRAVPLPASITRAGTAGANSFLFNGTISGKKLDPGTYLLVATPAGAQPQHARFKIAR